jgi:RHS repeat-associated protein
VILFQLRFLLLFLSLLLQVSASGDNINNRYLSEKSYLWGTNDKLLSVVTNGKTKHFEYDGWGNLSKTVFEDGKAEHRNPDKTGNLFERLDRLDRKYAAGGRLLKTENWEYKYDKEGNLIRKRDKHGQTWRYEWNEAGMLESVKRPDAQEVSFKYDALGRRIEKRLNNIVTRWLWDGNVPLHERRSHYTLDWDEVNKTNYYRETKYPLVTWVFEEGTFVPAAKITEKEQFSIVTNYLGTPEAMYREDGEAVWTCELNSYGKVRNFQGESKTMCPFRYQGQYEDAETGLYYNRFRYYSPEEGMYLSQDPIGLNGGANLYAYVFDSNIWVDLFGLVGGGSYNEVRRTNVGGEVHHIPSNKANKANGYTRGEGPAIIMTKADHKRTASWGRSRAATIYRANQAVLISQGQSGYAKAMENDIRDIKSRHKTKYNASLVEAVEYAKNHKLISDADAGELKKICNK